MSIIKSKDMDWRKYIRLLAESGGKPSEMEKIELSGYLMRDPSTFGNIYDIFDGRDLEMFTSNLLIAESPDTSEDLLNYFKKSAVHYYDDTIAQLVSDEMDFLKDQKLAENPKDEYDAERDL